MMKRIFCLLLCCMLLFPVAACKKNEAQIRIYTLNGTTGFGMAPLIAADTADDYYNFTVETDATVVRDAILSESADIAALPTNVAAALYNATNGGVRVLALNTAGVLYVVTADTTVTTLADLAGKTLYTPAQNPAFITAALLKQAGYTDITLDSTTYAKPEELRDAIAGGLVSYAVLPEPMVTIAISSAKKSGITLLAPVDLTREWASCFTGGAPVQGCIVVRTAFLEAHPTEVTAFLEAYKAAIEEVKAEPAAAAQKIATAGIFKDAAVTELALPR